MAINQAFCNHGIFTEGSVTVALGRYSKPPGAALPTTQSIDDFVSALRRMHVTNVWIQLFSRGGDLDKNNAALRIALIARLRQVGIAWAGWGYCSGKNAQRDLQLIRDLRATLAMDAFVIDAEPGNLIYKDPNNPNKRLPDLWDENEFETFVSDVSNVFGKDNLGISTWPVLKLQKEYNAVKLMQRAAPHVCMFAPQAYWMTFPGKPHYDAGFAEKDYPRGDPAAFVRLVVDSWRLAGINNPIVISGQAYWDSGENTPSQATMEAKVDMFLQNYQRWQDVIGFNWYHAGMKNTADEGSMSDRMISSIAAADIATKPFQQP